MLNRAGVGWLALGLAVVIALGVVVIRREAAPALPEPKSYARLPPAFQQRLDEARARVQTHARDAAEWRNLAKLYHANRLYAEARSCYARVAALPGGLATKDHYFLADIGQSFGELETTEAELKLILARQPDYLPAQLTLAETFFKTGRPDQAGDLWRAVVAREANQPQASVGLARLELQEGKDDAAIARLEALLGQHLDCVSGFALLAQIMRRRGETTRAEALTTLSQQKQEAPPPDPWMDELLTDCYDVQRLSLRFEELLNSGQIDVALPLLDRVEALDPQNWVAPLLRGSAASRSHQDREAVRFFRVALERGGDVERVAPLILNSLLTLNETAEALAFAREQHQRKPASVDILSAYATLALRTGDRALAQELLEKLVRADPYHYLANMSLAKLLWASGGRERAVECLRRVALAFPNDVASRGLLAEHYLERSDPRSAIPFLEQALPVAEAGAPRDRLTGLLVAALLHVANAEAAENQIAAAADHFARASALAPSQPEGFAGEAALAAQLKQYRRAADALKKLATLQPENPTIELSLGDVLYQNDERDAARSHWARAQQLAANDDADLRAALKERLEGRISAATFR